MDCIETEKPSYYAIIPAFVRYDERLSSSEKLMYGELTCLTNKLGYCYATNGYFAKLYGKDVSTISRWVKNLEECGYISVAYEREGVQVSRRIIKMIDIPEKVLKNCNEGIEFLQERYCKNRKENNTRYNNTSNNIYTVTEEKPKKTRKPFTTNYEQVLNICIKNSFKGMNNTEGEMAEWFCKVALNEDGTVCYKGNNIKSYIGLVSMLRSIDANGKSYSKVKTSRKSISTLNEGCF